MMRSRASNPAERPRNAIAYLNLSLLGAHSAHGHQYFFSGLCLANRSSASPYLLREKHNNRLPKLFVTTRGLLLALSHSSSLNLLVFGYSLSIRRKMFWHWSVCWREGRSVVNRRLARL